MGIVAGCMPVIQPTLSSRFAKAVRLPSFRSLILRVFVQFSRTAVSRNQNRQEGRKGRLYLETEILHGVDGNGKFMSSVESPEVTQYTLLSPPRSPFRTWASGRNNNSNINNTAIGTQISDQSMMVTMTSIVPDSHSNISQERDPNRQYMLQVDRIRNMV
jgi:hypothetical protein